MLQDSRASFSLALAIARFTLVGSLGSSGKVESRRGQSCATRMLPRDCCASFTKRIEPLRPTFASVTGRRFATG